MPISNMYNGKVSAYCGILVDATCKADGIILDVFGLGQY